MTDAIDARYRVARELIRDADALALEYFYSDDLVTESKGLQDRVSVADREVERLIRDALAERFAGQDAVLAAEDDLAGPLGVRGGGRFAAFALGVALRQCVTDVAKPADHGIRALVLPQAGIQSATDADRR